MEDWRLSLDDQRMLRVSREGHWKPFGGGVIITNYIYSYDEAIVIVPRSLLWSPIDLVGVIEREVHNGPPLYMHHPAR